MIFCLKTSGHWPQIPWLMIIFPWRLQLLGGIHHFQRPRYVANVCCGCCFTPRCWWVGQGGRHFRNMFSGSTDSNSDFIVTSLKHMTWRHWESSPNGWISDIFRLVEYDISAIIFSLFGAVPPKLKKPGLLIGCWHELVSLSNYRDFNPNNHTLPPPTSPPPNTTASTTLSKRNGRRIGL